MKYEKATYYFNKKEYNKCVMLLETIIPFYRPTKDAEKINYMYAFSEYSMGNYVSASLRFKSIYETYPFDSFAEESLFLYAYNMFLLSPPIEQDQSITSNAIDGLQLFITKYPASKKVEDANKCMDELMLKMETKDYNTARLYYKIEDYRASVWALRKFLEKYPSSDRKNEITYLILYSYYKVAINSVEEKKKDRFGEVTGWYINNLDILKKTQYAASSENIYNNALNHLKKLK